MIQKKLLLVSSNENNIDRLYNILVSANCDVQTANSKEKALLVINSFNPDLVILDNTYYNHEGSELTRSLFESGVLFLFICQHEIEKVSVTSSNPEKILNLLPDIDIALKWVSDIRRMKETEKRYSKAIQTGRVVDVVIGILMERHNLQRESAFELLRQKARSERIQLRVLAQEILDAEEKINTISSK
ncbi:MAG: response regulator [Candidatus Thiodiazotropha lotti]|nr:response regulator [Candidatus Thiodiazotropha lotti]MCW4219109.1 response regulator [Candidatus Thiodiazotropha lotti]